MNTNGKNALVQFEQAPPAPNSRSAFSRNNPTSNTIQTTTVDQVLQGARDAAAQQQNRLHEFKLVNVGSAASGKGGR
jgi:hypothetical protein